MTKARKSKEAGIGERFESLEGSLNERSRRLLAASEARAFGYGGIAAVSRATGMARATIGFGLRELEEIETGKAKPLPLSRVRRPGAGRRKTTEKDPTLLPHLRALAESTTRGDRESPLLWTAKSQRNIVAELKKQGHQTSTKMVARL